MKRVICLFLSYQFIILGLDLNSINAFAQDDSGKVQCTDEYKLELLVKKGIMTKDTCFELEGNKLKLNVTGRTYKLAQTLDSQVSNTKSIPNGGLVCEGITNDLDGDGVKVSENDFLNQTAFGRFGTFLSNLRNQIANLKKRLISEGSTEEANALSNQILLTGTGYADGVRVTSPAFDQEIYSDANNMLYGPAFQLLGKANESFDNKRKIFQEIACAFNSDQSSVTDKTKLKFLHKIRNIAIAKRRANNLTTVIKKASNLPANPFLKAITSDDIADTNNAGCYGYCALRRGATVDIEIPGLEYYTFGVRKEDVEIAPSFNTPASHDQVIMNAIAMRTFARDYEYWLKLKLKEDGPYSGNGNAILNAFLYIYSLKTGNGQSNGDQLIHPYKKTLQMLPMYVISKIAPNVYSRMKERLKEYITDDSRKSYKALVQKALNDNGRLNTSIDNERLYTALYKHKKEYMLDQLSDYQTVINNLKANFLLSVEMFVKDKYKLSDSEIAKFKDLIKWTSTALTFTINDSVDINIPKSRLLSRLKSSGLENNEENKNRILQEEFFKEVKRHHSLYSILPLSYMTSGTQQYFNTMINSNEEDDKLPHAFGVALSSDEMQQMIIQTFYDLANGLKAKREALGRNVSKIPKQTVKEAYLATIGEYGIERALLKAGTNEFKEKFDQYINSEEVGIEAINLISEDISAELNLRMGALISRKYKISTSSTHAPTFDEVTFPAGTHWYADRFTGTADMGEISPISFYLNTLASNTKDTQTRAYINELNKAYYHLINITYLFNSRSGDINEDKEVISLFPENMMRSNWGGDTSAIFSFMDYRDAYAAMLNHTTNNSSTSVFTNTAVLEKQLRTIRDDQDVQRIFFDVSKIATNHLHREGNERINFKGFFHTACLTGVIFPLDGTTTEFNYQSRMIHHRKDGRNMNDYKDYDNGSKGPTDKEIYDYTFDLPKKYPEMKLFNLAALKRPTSYLIPNCKACDCLKYRNEESKGGDMTGRRLEEILATAKVLDFSQGYEWKSKENDPNIKYPEKDFTKEELGITGPISGNYCLYSPIVPQSHNLGSGGSNGTPDDGTGKSDEVKCPIADATNGIAELDLSLDEVNDIIRTCASVMRRFPMSETDCENSKLNNKCLLLDKAGFEAAGISEANIPIQDVLTGEWTGSSDCLAPATQEPPTKMCNSKVLLSR